MDLRHLRYFAAVADTGGMSSAARQLHVTQPALSRQIQDLERELGVPLFDRVGRRVRLTAEGADLLRRTRDVLTAAAAVAERARALRGGDVAILRVGVPPMALETLVAPFLMAYRRANPGIDVEVTEAGTAELLRRLERGELHLALSAPPKPEERGFGVRLLQPARILAVFPAKRRVGRTVEIAALAGERVLLLPRGFGTRDTFDAACRLAQITPRTAMESSTPHSLLALAEAGDGVAIVPSSTRLTGRRVRAAAVVRGGESVGVWVVMVWNRRAYLPPAAGPFMDGLAAHSRRHNPTWRYERTAPPLPPPSWLVERATSPAR